MFFIKNQMKSPRSVDFPTYGDNNVSITNHGDYNKVTEYVDTENRYLRENLL